MIGRTLGHYKIVEPLGAGGMGEVYRAHDEKLDRDVALKVLPEGALSGEEARQRFRREANALSRLSHPHIATIFDFDSVDGIDFLVMELVRGPSLADELQARGAFPEKTAVRLGAQIARGLQAAHEQGVIHRDLKPSNLQLTPDGMVKILDFGLARLAAPVKAGETEPTQTAVGRAAGTLPYMSPEQLRGRGVDARTDIYALGAVLYELATGRRLFAKRSAAELTAAILDEEPAPLREANDRISPAFEALVLKAIDKDVELRYQNAKDLLVDLERLQQRSDSRSSRSGPVGSPQTMKPRSGASRGWWWAAAAALLTVLIASVAGTLRPPEPPRITSVDPLRLDVGPTFSEWYVPTWTTDGARLYFVAKKEGRFVLHQAPVSGGESVEIPTLFESGLELYGYLHRHSALVVLANPHGSPFGGAPVWLLPLPSGQPRRLGEHVANAVAISPDEERLALTILEREPARIEVVRIEEPFAAPEATIPLPPGAGGARWSQDGRRLRFTAPGPEGHQDERWLWETSITGEAARPLWPGAGGAWTRSGNYFVFEHSDPRSPTKRSDLYAVREGRWPRVRAEPVQLTAGPVSFQAVQPQPGGGGLLAFGTDSRAELHRVDRRIGRREPFLGGESIGMVRFSPDGEWMAWVTFPETKLWRSRPDGSERLQLSASLWAYMPSWSPDGTQIAFVGGESGDAGLSVRRVSVDGGRVEVLKEAAPGVNYWDACWLPDGRSVVFSRMGKGIELVDVETRESRVFPGADQFRSPKCGPNGQILASKRGGGDRRDGGPSNEFVVFWPEKGEWEVAGAESLAYPNWTRDGRSVCGLAMMALHRIECLSLDTGESETVFEITGAPLFTWPNYPWMGLDPDDNPLVMLDRSTRDLYALNWEAP